jgi:tryptophanase
MSSKKSGLVNIGGFIAVKDRTTFLKLHPKLIRTDGFITYGGLAGRDLEALAVGLLEGVNDYYLMDRQRQVEYFANALKKRGVAIYEPAACFAVFINAGKCLPHIKPLEGPGTALASQAYIEGGLGITPFDSLHRAREDSKDPLNMAKLGLSPFELIRCAIPRRVYTEAHYEVAADAVEAAMKHGAQIPPYRRIKVDRPPIELKDIGLRPFFDEFEPMGVHP